MKNKKYSTAPLDAKDRINVKPIVCYPIDDLKETNLPILHSARNSLKNIGEIIIPPRAVSYTHLTLPTNREV